MKVHLPSPPQRFSPAALRALALPIILTTLVVLVSLLGLSATSIPGVEENRGIIQFSAMAGILYVTSLYLLFLKYAQILHKLKWIIAILNGIALGLLTNNLPANFSAVFYITTAMGIMITALIFNRTATYLAIAVFTMLRIVFDWPISPPLPNQLAHFALPSLAIIIAETITRLQNIYYRQVTRLETINEFSKQISASLDIDQLIPLLNDAIKNAIQADTYYVGILEQDHIKLDLFYDEGEYFYDIFVPLEGSLAGWIARHNLPLFLPDLRQELNLDGVNIVIIGKSKTSLSWMGVPLTAGKILGVMAVACYQPNAFDQSDMELLENLAQSAALILHNALHHTYIEEQSQLDSLTGAYNHGHLLKKLEANSQKALVESKPLSLIMLDVDYFKQYNDTYGHLAGDQVLVQLTQAIRQHIKSTDAVGRWGGEEFAVCLPNANGTQAHQIARRIQDTLRNTPIRISGKTIPSPTISQGIAVFPNEANEVIRLIDLADQRLYKAKARGRNQIDPESAHWEKTRPTN